MLGRVFSLYFSIAILPSAIGLLFAGFIADAIGVANAFVISGWIVVLIGVASFFTPSLMRLGYKKASICIFAIFLSSIAGNTEFILLSVKCTLYLYHHNLGLLLVSKGYYS